MTELREAFCELLAKYPGPDATRYIEWARSDDPEDTAELEAYVRDSVRAIEHVGGEDERAYLPMLRRLHRELMADMRAYAERRTA